MLQPQTPGPDVVPGLPDVATLARLATELFAALPGEHAQGSLLQSPRLATRDASSMPATGGVPVPAHVQPAGASMPPGSHGPATPSATVPGAALPGANLVPTSAQSPANAAANAPKLMPHAQAPNGLPDVVLVAAPGHDGRLGGQALAVPQATPDPRIDAAGPAAWQRSAGSSFYFLPVAAGHTPSVLDFELPGGTDALVPKVGVPQAAPLQPRSVSSPGHGFPGLSAWPRPGLHEPFDVQAIRRDFPILQERVNVRPLVWFDNAATTQKPQVVIDRLARFYAHENSNIHRAAHELAARATDAYEQARETVRRFIGAASVDEIIFVRGTTEAINLVAQSWGGANIGAGDEIVISHLEHHANIVPWQQLAAQRGARIRVIPVDDDGQVLLDEYQKLLNDRTRIVSVTQVSNALGTVVPVRQIVQAAHRRGIRTLVDGAQSVSHMRVDVRALDTDFFVFSGHKVFGPTGIGVVYGKKAVLDGMPPWQGGGNMIADVTFERTTYHGPPTRFEAGTGNIADAVGLGAALEYVERIGIEAIGAYEHALLDYATALLRPIPGLRLVGTAQDKASVLSFVLQGYGTDEVGQALNEAGIAVRTGHHCAQPILRRFGLESTVRPSLAFYNTCDEVDRLVEVVQNLAAARPARR